MTAWSDNDSLFRQELAHGFEWQLYVARRLIDLGFEVEVPKLRFRDNIEVAQEFEDEPDLLWEGRIIEVKSRKLYFTSPEDFPYDTLLVDTVNGWSAKERKPTEYVCVSTETGQIICLGGETHHLWGQNQRYDHTRKINDVFYEAHKSLWVSFEVMVAQMRAYKNLRDSQIPAET